MGPRLPVYDEAEKWAGYSLGRLGIAFLGSWDFGLMLAFAVEMANTHRWAGAGVGQSRKGLRNDAVEI